MQHKTAHQQKFTTNFKLLK